jgi:hypothetical protein
MRDLGVEVWWDEEMPGVDWQRELERRINALAAVIVLWTPASMNSENVRDEARLGQRMGKLANVLVSVSAPPFPFDRVNGLPLDGWIRNQPHGGWARLVRTVEDHLVTAGIVKPGLLTGRLSDRETMFTAARDEVGRAELNYQAAVSEHEKSAAAVDAAEMALGTAEEQHRRVIEIRGSTALLRASRTETEEALASKRDAEDRRKACAIALAHAAETLAAATANLARLGAETNVASLLSFESIERPLGKPPPEPTQQAPSRQPPSQQPPSQQTASPPTPSGTQTESHKQTDAGSMRDVAGTNDIPPVTDGSPKQKSSVFARAMAFKWSVLYLVAGELFVLLHFVVNLSLDVGCNVADIGLIAVFYTQVLAQREIGYRILIAVAIIAVQQHSDVAWVPGLRIFAVAAFGMAGLLAFGARSLGWSNFLSAATGAIAYCLLNFGLLCIYVADIYGLPAGWFGEQILALVIVLIPQAMILAVAYFTVRRTLEDS